MRIIITILIAIIIGVFYKQSIDNSVPLIERATIRTTDGDVNVETILEEWRADCIKYNYKPTLTDTVVKILCLPSTHSSFRTNLLNNDVSNFAHYTPGNQRHLGSTITVIDTVYDPTILKLIIYHELAHHHEPQLKHRTEKFTVRSESLQLKYTDYYLSNKDYIFSDYFEDLKKETNQ